MANVVIEPSILIGDATCPQCGHLLWFFQTTETIRVFDAERASPSKDRCIDIVANQLGVDQEYLRHHPTLLDDIGADSLDTVELVMAFEEEFHR